MYKIQYISQGETYDQQYQNVENVLKKGVQWVQLRWKKADFQELKKLAIALRELCKNYGAIFIINDNVELAKEIDADGVHLGLTDTKIAEARKILGENKIIGGTANTLQDVEQRIEEGCNYIGLGPFRFTTTKENLSPILGLEGYHNILQSLRAKYKEIPPIYAIGGIRQEDIEALYEVGVYGIAVSGLLTE